MELICLYHQVLYFPYILELWFFALPNLFLICRVLLNGIDD
jgi:hypothetical protein